MLLTYDAVMTRIGLAWVIGASALVLAADFPWGDLQNHTHWSKVGWIPFVSPPVKPLDIAQNLLLCAPIGAAGALAVGAFARHCVAENN